MYNFIDTTEVSDSVILPSEALQINGEYIENLISGYRTLHVTGRESLSPDLSTFETGVRDGSSLLNKRYPERTIVVTYQLIAESNEAFREAYNQLGRILNVENAELIFNDETDKFFIGTPADIGEVSPGTNSVVGEFEILCTDPFKYSVVEYEVEQSLDDNSILIDYNGTYKSYPTLEADFYSETDVDDDGETALTLTGAGDCGYVAFFNENEKIIQLGDPSEQDGTGGYAKSQTLMNQTFLSNTAWGTTAKSLWAVNSAPISAQQLGNVGMNIASYTSASMPTSQSLTLLSKTSTSSEPKFDYTVKAKVYNRYATTVRIDFTITTALTKSSSYFGRGYALTGYITINGSKHTVPIKSTSEYWKGTSGHTKNLSLTLSISELETTFANIYFQVDRTDSTGGTAGKLSSTACKSITVWAYEVKTPSGYYLSATNYGTASGAWHGPSITRTLGADATGDYFASDFTLTYRQKMCASHVKQYGAFRAQALDADGNTIAGVRIQKNKAGNNGNIYLAVNGKTVYTTIIDLSLNNQYFGENSTRTSSIIKSGGKISFNICGFKKTFIDDALDGVKCTDVMFMFEQYAALTPFAYNGLYWAKLVKNNCATWKDIPNKFSANDVIEADCKEGKIYLNGVESPALGALGNDWEEFYLTNGLNQIGVSYSDWVTDEYAPKFKVRYREVFL